LHEKARDSDSIKKKNFEAASFSEPEIKNFIGQVITDSNMAQTNLKKLKGYSSTNENLLNFTLIYRQYIIQANI